MGPLWQVDFFPGLSLISAPAKCAQLLVSIKQKRPEDQDAEGFQKVLHFGSVAVGCTAERKIKLYNPSTVGEGEGSLCISGGGDVLCIRGWRGCPMYKGGGNILCMRRGQTTELAAPKTHPLYKMPSSCPYLWPQASHKPCLLIHTCVNRCQLVSSSLLSWGLGWSIL